MLEISLVLEKSFVETLFICTPLTFLGFSSVSEAKRSVNHGRREYLDRLLKCIILGRKCIETRRNLLKVPNRYSLNRYVLLTSIFTVQRVMKKSTIWTSGLCSRDSTISFRTIIRTMRVPGARVCVSFVIPTTHFVYRPSPLAGVHV